MKVKIHQLFIFRFFFIGLAVVMAIEMAFIIFLDKFYFADNSQYHAQLVNGDNVKVTDAKISIDNGITGISYSYDGKYISYLSGGIVSVCNMQTGDRNVITAADNMNITNYKWIYDRDRLIIAERSDNASTPYYRLYYYDTGDKTTAEIYNGANNTRFKINTLENSEKIDQVEMSTLTNLIYIKFSDESGDSRLYRINIMGQKSTVKLRTKHIGKIALLKQDDVLVYEDSYNGRVYTTGRTSSVTIDGQNQFKIIGLDEEDNVYLAYISGGLVNSIYYGDITKNKWSKMALPAPAVYSSLYLNRARNVFQCDQGSHTLTNLLTGKGVTFKGDFSGVITGGYISQDGSDVYRGMS